MKKEEKLGCNSYRFETKPIYFYEETFSDIIMSCVATGTAFRKLKSVDTLQLRLDIQSHLRCSTRKIWTMTCACSFTDKYSTVLSTLLGSHAPL